MGQVIDVKVKTSTEGTDTASKQIDDLTKKIQGLGTTADASTAQMANASSSIGKFQTSADKGAQSVHGLHESFTKLGEGAKGLTGIMAILGKVFGIDTETIKGLMEVHGGLREAMRATNDIVRASTVETEASTAAKEENVVATEAQIAADGELVEANEAVGASMLEMAGPIGLAAAAVVGAIVAIYQYIKAGEELKAFNKLLAEGEKELLELREKALTAQQKLDIASGKITKEQAEKDNVTIAQQKATLKAAIEHKEALEKLGERPEERINNAGDVYNQKEIDTYDNTRKQLEQQTQDKLDAIMEAGNDSRAAIDDDAKNKSLHAEDQYLREIALLRDKFMKNELERTLAELETNKKFDIKEEQDGLDSEDDKLKKIGEIKEKYRLKEQLAIQDDNKKQEEEAIKAAKEQEKANDELLKYFIKKEEERVAFLKKIHDDQEKADDANLELNKSEEDLRFEQTLKGHKATEEQEQDHEKRLYDIERQALLDKIELDKDDYDAHERDLAALAELDANYIKNREKENEKSQKELLKYIEDFTSALEKELDIQNKAYEDSLQYRTQLNEKQIDVDKSLAERGLQTDLAFQIRKAALLKKQQIDEARTTAKEKELLTLVSSVPKFIEEGKSPLEALAAAIAVVAAMKVAESKFEEGGIVRNGIGGGIQNGVFSGRRHSGGGILIEAEGGEGILSRKEMDSLGGAEGFYNLKEMLKDPSKAVSASILNVSSNNGEVVQELKAVREAIHNKKETTVDWESLDLRITEIERGVKTVTTHKRKLL